MRPQVAVARRIKRGAFFPGAWCSGARRFEIEMRQRDVDLGIAMFAYIEIIRRADDGRPVIHVACPAHRRGEPHREAVERRPATMDLDRRRPRCVANVVTKEQQSAFFGSNRGRAFQDERPIHGINAAGKPNRSRLGYEHLQVVARMGRQLARRQGGRGGPCRSGHP